MSEQHTIVITGGTGGIGLHSALGLAKGGAHIVVVGRSQTRGEEAVRRIKLETNNHDIDFVRGDLASIAGIDQLAHSLRRLTPKIDVLVNNAGYLGAEFRQSPDGLEMHFAVNVLGPWRLTAALLPQLQAAGLARVVNVSGGDKPARIDAENLQAEKGFRGLMTYTHSKSVMEAMSIIQAGRYEGQGVSVNIVFPGRASTAMTQSLSPQALPGPMKIMYPLFRFMFREDGGKSAAKAAQSTIWSATTSELQDRTGAYFDSNCVERKLHPSAYDPEVHQRILSVLDSVAAPSPGDDGSP